MPGYQLNWNRITIWRHLHFKPISTALRTSALHLGVINLRKSQKFLYSFANSVNTQLQRILLCSSGLYSLKKHQFDHLILKAVPVTIIRKEWTSNSENGHWCQFPENFQPIFLFPRFDIFELKCYFTGHYRLIVWIDVCIKIIAQVEWRVKVRATAHCVRKLQFNDASPSCYYVVYLQLGTLCYAIKASGDISHWPNEGMKGKIKSSPVFIHQVPVLN